MVEEPASDHSLHLKEGQSLLMMGSILSPKFYVLDNIREITSEDYFRMIQEVEDKNIERIKNGEFGEYVGMCSGCFGDEELPNEYFVMKGDKCIVFRPHGMKLF